MVDRSFECLNLLLLALSGYKPRASTLEVAADIQGHLGRSRIRLFKR